MKHANHPFPAHRRSVLHRGLAAAKDAVFSLVALLVAIPLACIAAAEEEHDARLLATDGGAAQ